MDLKISKEEGNIMKGIAIIFIALHNMAHLSSKFIQENESRFDVNSPKQFVNNILSYSPTLFGDFFSFLGWYGVPTFMFLGMAL